MRRSGPGEDPATTVVVTYKVLLREGKDGTDYTTERTFRSLVQPRRRGGPYLCQEGDVFFVDVIPKPGGPIYGWLPSATSSS